MPRITLSFYDTIVMFSVICNYLTKPKQKKNYRFCIYNEIHYQIIHKTAINQHLHCINILTKEPFTSIFTIIHLVLL